MQTGDRPSQHLGPRYSLSQRLGAKFPPALPLTLFNNQFGHYHSALRSETAAAVASLFQRQCKHTQLCDWCVKPQILQGNAPVTG